MAKKATLFSMSHFLQLHILSAVSAEDFLHVVIFGSLPAGNVYTLIYLFVFFFYFVFFFFICLFPFSFLVLFPLFFLAVCPEKFFLYPSFIIWITVFLSTLSIFLVLHSTFRRMSLQTSTVWVSRE